MVALLFDIFGLPALAALATALLVTWLGRRLSPTDRVDALVLPVAVAIAFFVGYASLPRSFAALLPQRNQTWQWLPYLGLAAAAISTMVHPCSRIAARLVSLIAIAGIAAIAIAPTWPVFGLSRQPVIWSIGLYLLVVGTPLQFLPPRPLTMVFLGMLTTAAALLAVVAGALVSIRLSQLAAIAAGALAGSTIAFAFGSKSSQSSPASLAPVFVTLVGGAAIIVALEPDPPRLGLLSIPLVPLATWLMVARPQGATI